MTRYEHIVDIIIRLQNCLKFQRVLSSDLVSKLDLLTQPRVGISIAVAIWANDGLKRGALSYTDIMYIQRRLAQFLARAADTERETLRRLLSLMPTRLGMDVETLSRRCIIDMKILLELFKALNMLQEVYSIASSGIQISEPLRRDPRLCLSDPELLPPAHANSEVYVELIVKTLNETPEVVRDPVASHIVEVINDKIVRGRLMASDIAAIALLALALAKQFRNTTICTDPCISLEALARRVYSDITALGAEPAQSDIYSLYRDLLMKSVFRT